MVERNFYSIKEVSLLTGKKVRTVRDWIAKGKIKAAKFPSSRRWVIPESEISKLKGE